MKTMRQTISLVLLFLILLLPSAFCDDYMRWGLPDGAKMRIGKGEISGNITFSPDSSLLAIASAIGIWIYDANTGKELQLLTNNNEYIRSVAFSPDGKTIASSSAAEFYLWDIATGELKTILSAHTDEISGIEFSPDGKTLATCSNSDDRSVKFWDVATGALKTTLIGHTDSVNCLAYSPNGQFLATGGEDNDSTIKIWDVATGGLKTAITIKSKWNFYGITDIAFSSDGSTIAGCDGWWDANVYLCDAVTGTLKTTLIGHMDSVESVAFSPDSRTLASGSGDGTVCLWDGSTGNHKTTLIAHTADVTSVVFSPDGTTLASGSKDGTIILWDAESLQQKSVITEHTAPGSEIDFSPDGRKIVTACRDKTVRLWDTTTGKNVTTFGGHIGPVSSVAFNSDGYTIASSDIINVFDYGSVDDYIVRLWDAVTGTQTAALFGHKDDVYFVDFSPDGRILATSSRGTGSRKDGKVVLWDAATGNSLWILPSDGQELSSIVFSPDGRTFATGNLSEIRLWDIVNRESIKTFSGSIHWYSRMVFSPDGQTLATVGVVNKVLLWNVATGESETIHTGHIGRLAISIAYSPDGKTLVTAGDRGDGTLRFWNPVNGELKLTLTSVSNGVDSITFSPDGSTLATLDNGGSILLWDYPSLINPPQPEADVNSDGVVDIYDLVVVAANFGQTGPNPADVNGDGVVNIADLIKVAGALDNAAAAPLNLALNQKFTPTRVDVQKWLFQAQQLNLTDATSQKGIRFLEQLLTALTPKKTALLPNYPNPFNPETWIPYQLAESTNVTIQIYSGDGQLIRTLGVGHQPAGLYQQQNRAAYWDGKNEIGEPVASGVYFYTLTAGQFSATRKMLIRK